jgi:hypothetical protein
VDLFATVGRPIVSGLTASANIQPEPPSLVFKGTPVLLFGDAGETGENQIELSWQGGRLNLPVKSSENDIGETVWLLQGSRLITDWESRYPTSEAWAPLEKRKQSRVAAQLLALSQTYGLASREMSLVAVVKRAGDRPGQLPETRVVPVGMAQDTAFRAYFLSQAGEAMDAMPADASGFLAAMAPASIERARRGTAMEFTTLFSRGDAVGKFGNASRRAETAEDILLELASRIDSDGGMPGKNSESRAGATVIAVLAFLSQGHTPTIGAFRSHVARLVSFLQSLTGLSSHQQEMVAAVVELARKGAAPTGEWITLARTSGDHWKEVERGVRKGAIPL